MQMQGLLRMLKPKQADTECPNFDELRDFANGCVSDERFHELAQHIEDCDTCGIVMDCEIDQDPGDLLEQLQKLDTPLASSLRVTPESVPRQLVDAACRAMQSRSEMATFDSGSQLASRLKDGPIEFGRFELLSELGSGSFGYVFKAWDTTLKRLVAIKVQRAGLLATDEATKRFLLEAQSTAKLNHPNIVSMHDTVRLENDTYCLVSQYVEGESLESALKKSQLSANDCARLIAHVADALHFAHEMGIIHRDVKPSNILIDHIGVPHITDFGMAKQTSDESVMTSCGRVMGTPAYMSPEQAAGESNAVDARCDVYSLGVILYELLTGERPFQGNRRMLLLQVIGDDPRSPRQLDARIPIDLETICLKALSKAPSSRYQSAADMADDLRRYLNHQPVRARRLGAIGKTLKWCRRYPVAASLLLAVPLVAIGGFAYLSMLSTHFVHSTALESTRMEANMLEDINEFYSEQVVGPLDQEKIPVTHQYASASNSVPLPFTFMIDAGERISSGESGMQVRIYSDYPWRENGGPINLFERQAIEELGLGCRTLSDERTDTRLSAKADVDGRSYHQFDTVNGEPVLRYARAQIMKQSCIDCHNNDALSPKRNWVVGEVAGVLSITRPLKRDIDATTNGLRSAFFLIGGIAISLTAFAMCLFWSMKHRAGDLFGATDARR